MEDMCPCCLRQEASPGLFEKMPESEKPVLLQGREQEIDDSGEVLESAGRFFLLAKMPLPFHRESTPIVPEVWVEVSEQAAGKIRDVLLGERRSYSGAAQLATDLPGFPGTAGSPCRLRFRKEGEVIDCTDTRISTIPADLDHQEMAALYRILWGNDNPVPAARHALRKEVRQALHNHVSQRSYTRQVEPPPQLAGIDPGEVLVFPPLDTGKPARLYTVGCSDVEDGRGGVYEIATFLQNPSDELVRCFGEFVYLSRMNPAAPLPGQVVPERNPIPDSDGRMIAWILLYPWDFGFVSGSVNYICAIPLLDREVAFAAIHGSERLAEELRASSEDLTALRRGSCVPEVFD